MRKRAFLAILMIAALVLTTGCGLIVKDAAVDAQTVIIQVAGKTITKAEVQAETQNQLAYEQYMYSYYGLSYDPTDAATISAAQDSAIQSLIQSAVIAQKITQGAFDTFTDEELAQAQTDADTSYQSYADSVKASYFADTTLTGADLDAAIAAKLTELGYPTREQLLQNQKDTLASNKLRESVVGGVTVTDDELQTAFDQKVTAAQTSYASSLAQYGTDVNNGSTIYYRPAGYRTVKNILVKFSDADSTAISDLQSQITAKQSELDTNTASMAALPTDATTDTAEQAQTRTELTAAKAALEAALSDLNTQLTAAQEKAYAALQPTVDEIQAQLAAGGDFDALMAQYGQDPGMQSEPGKTDGYLVCAVSTQWVTEFTTNAMALVKVGDVSAPFRTSYGIHILKYSSDVAEGAVPLADVKDTLSAELLSDKQDTLYSDTVTQWVTEANAKTYKDRLAD